MEISELTIRNFRNFDFLKIKFSGSINFIIGDNGSGKTNLLEAISVAATLKSFRNNIDADMIKWGSDSYFCRADLKDSENSVFEVGCMNSTTGLKKKVKIDGAQILKSSDYYGKFLTVVFSPIDINLVNGSPEVRRKYFDSVISKYDNEYMKTLSEFKKILFSRNQLLKKMRTDTESFDELNVWDKFFIEKAEIITKKRKSFIESFNNIFEKTYESIAEESNMDSRPGINFFSSFDVLSDDDLKQLMLKNRKKDIITGTTNSGPHRDDYIISNRNSVKFTSFASQGERRTASIAVKISEKIIIEKATSGKCVLLVDDIFSELDEKRRANMIDLLRGGNQVIFTVSSGSTVNSFSDMKCKKFIFSGKGILSEA